MSRMRLIGDTGLHVPPLGFGTFKIGRNQGVKYPQPYDLPDLATVSQLLNSVLDLGCSLIDTAPAYGLSEERIGQTIAHRRHEFVLSTKVGEVFTNGRSAYDFTPTGIRSSLERSLRYLKTDVLDIVFIHSNGEDLKILQDTATVEILQEFRDRGLIRAIGLSGKTVAGAELALKWADLLMIEYHMEDTSHQQLIAQAERQGVAIFVKKGFSSGKLDPAKSIQFAFANPGVTSLVVGGLNFQHFRENWLEALRARPVGNHLDDAAG